MQQQLIRTDTVPASPIDSNITVPASPNGFTLNPYNIYQTPNNPRTQPQILQQNERSNPHVNPGQRTTPFSETIPTDSKEKALEQHRIEFGARNLRTEFGGGKKSRKKKRKKMKRKTRSKRRRRRSLKHQRNTSS